MRKKDRHYQEWLLRLWHLYRQPHIDDVWKEELARQMELVRSKWRSEPLPMAA